MVAKYKRNQHVEVRSFLDDSPPWLPAVVRRALPGALYSVVMRSPNGKQVTVVRGESHEIRPLKGDTDAT